MNKHERYVDICKQMELLNITDVTTNRQHRNGTRVWRLPIQYSTHPKFIEVASFASGYVRNQNGGYTNYQLNKRVENEPEYWKDYKWNDDMTKQTFTGKYRKFVTRGCKLIPNEIDRLEYLIAYCLKNYYIKLANQVINGRYVSKWEHEYELEKANETYSENTGAMERINILEEDLVNMTEARDCYKDKLSNVKNKLALIEEYTRGY